MISIVVIVGALCSVVKPVNAICAYDNVKAYYFELVEEAENSCFENKSGNVCASFAAAKAIEYPVLTAVPESMDEVQRKKVMCENNEKLHLLYQKKADIIRRALDAENFKKDYVVPAKVAKAAQSNPDLLELKLRDYVIRKIRDEIKKHIDDLPLNEADIDVLALQVCKEDLKPVTRSIVKFLFEKADGRLDKVCGILSGE